MSYFNPWCLYGIKLVQCVYLYHSPLYLIHILETVVVIFGITTLRKFLLQLRKPPTGRDAKTSFCGKLLGLKSWL